MSDQKKKKNPYQDTLNLPQTDFSIRANAKEKEPELVKRWQDEDLHNKTMSHNEGNQRFVLHDGPPYTNGPIHLGHAFNKTLKDIITKSKRMMGNHVPLTPGWDCHGLPIELKVTTELGIEKDDAKKQNIDPLQFKRACRDYSNKWIHEQREQFKDLGLLADWHNPYLTMNPTYEASIIDAFATFVEKGHIERKGKTVPWCMSCQTVLATAEIEHKERKDPSTYILFEIDRNKSKELFPFIYESNPDLQLNFLIWTTTPWTIPLNRAVVLHPNAEYVVLQGKDKNTAFIVGKELADKVCETVGVDKVELAECDSVVFKDMKVYHPIVEDLQVPVILDDSVVTTDGTACLHSAPGCGPEDYLLGIKNGLDIFSPLSSDGKYTKGIMPAELEGMSVTDGQIWAIKNLHASGRLFHKQSIRHSYPHCWRCRNGLIFRATDQWFCDLKKNNLVENARKEIENIRFFPSWGQARLDSFIGNRTEWCISRQRQWGVPIPAILCKKCDHAYLNADFIRNIAEKVATEGIEYWDRATLHDFQEEGFIAKDFKCIECNNTDLNEFRQERDILDVWFDSGVSHHAVLSKDDRLGGIPADLYLEGSDQHRGWFQSSLLCSMVINEKAQTKDILTHGFIVDENKHKMSKSLGNTVEPQEIINQYSRDILRLWVASSDFENDVVISATFLKNVAGVYRRIRNTSRFMISNLFDFDIHNDAVEFEKLLKIDQYILSKMYDLHNTVIEHYNNYKFASIVQELNNFCTNDLSAMYLDILKDRLYVEQPDGHARRSGQTAVYHILDMLTHLMAPILSFLAEEVSDYYLKDKDNSVHLRNFPEALNIWRLVHKHEMPEYLKDLELSMQNTDQDVATSVLDAHTPWVILEEIRGAVLKAIEEQRQVGVIKHSLESKVSFFIDVQANDGTQVQKIISEFLKDVALAEDVDRFFQDWFIVSQVNRAQSPEGLEQSALPWVYVKVEKASGIKCPRCWQWDASHDTVHMDVHSEVSEEMQQPEITVEREGETLPLEKQLCGRCTQVLKK